MDDETNENVVIATEEVVESVIQKPKRKRTAKQLAAFHKCQAKRAENVRIRSELKQIKEREHLDKMLSKAKDKQRKKKKMASARKQVKKYRKTYVSSSSESSGSEPEVIVVKKKRRKKKQVHYVSSSDSEGSYDPPPPSSFYSKYF